MPISPYATTKRTGELLCFNYSHLYGLRTSCLRFFTVYGPGQRPEMAIHKFTDLLARGEKVPMYGDGETRRDYTYVDDIVDGIVAAYDLAPAFEIFNLGGAETHPPFRADPPPGHGACRRAEDRVSSRPTRRRAITYADVSKAGRLLGYSPRVPIREGLRRFVAWYKDNHPA